METTAKEQPIALLDEKDGDPAKWKMKTFRQVYCEVRDRTEDMKGEGISLSWPLDQESERSAKVPMAWHGIACWVCTGSSEGHYIHVDFVMDGGRRLPFLLAKTFNGWDHAWEMAKRISWLLGA